jgi:hypothetical protein
MTFEPADQSSQGLKRALNEGSRPVERFCNSDHKTTSRVTTNSPIHVFNGWENLLRAAMPEIRAAALASSKGWHICDADEGVVRCQNETCQIIKLMRLAQGTLQQLSQKASGKAKACRRGKNTQSKTSGISNVAKTG